MITKSAINPNTLKNEIKFTQSARAAWKLILASLEPFYNILLPSYIGVTDREGSGIFDPVEDLKLEYDFYLLNNDLSISHTDLERQLQKRKFNLVLLVHYFGFKDVNLEKAINLCKKYRALIVEDCAHIFNYNLYSLSSAGTKGDFAFYSLHKNFPIKSGGLLVQNNVSIPLVASMEDSKCEYCSEIFKYDFKKIAEKRIKNFHFLKICMEELPFFTPFRDLIPGDIPHTFPVIVKNGLREKLYFWLGDQSVPVIALYYRLIRPLQNEKYFAMQEISNNILNLPIHQDTTEEDICLLVQKIKRFYGKE